ncbi:MAG: glucosidase [Phycisphaeraceae bacterium]|nr:glucosidase [Phycisphaeraceae bacterium]
MNPTQDPELERLKASADRTANWQRWGTYLPERQWGTVREDYSADGACWEHFGHDQARSRAYRWGEDGLLGWCDRQCRLCFAVALWNERDPILKERFFGLTNHEGNHGEDVKELYFYQDALPSGAYARALYKYPQGPFPYEQLLEENRHRGLQDREFEILDTGLFDQRRYFDVQVEYAKAGPDQTHIRLTVTNRGPETARLHVLPTFWFRNTWSWGARHEAASRRPVLRTEGSGLRLEHETLGTFRAELSREDFGEAPTWLVTENETNTQKLYGAAPMQPHVKDAFHRYLIQGETEAVRRSGEGTKAAVHQALELAPGASQTLRLRLGPQEAAEESEGTTGNGCSTGDDPCGRTDELFRQRIEETDRFYDRRLPKDLNEDQKHICRTAYGGLIWTKQFYHYIVEDWLSGDPAMPPPPEGRTSVRNSDWDHLYSRDVLSMPDKWEYPWFAAWDLAFHMIPMAHVDPHFAKKQLILLLREWYMHPSGQLPAYEFALGDVNPPVHAWACWRVYKMTGPPGGRDRDFLASAFQKLLLNFTWWVNRKDPHGHHLFSGGFLGLDNIGVFDRSEPIAGGHVMQADATAWMAFYCGTMLSIALELAQEDRVYEDMASKFFEHFVAIIDAINQLGGCGLWDEADGFYYDQLHLDDQRINMRIRSMVGLVPLFAVHVLRHDQIESLSGFRKRMNWFLKHRPDLSRHVVRSESGSGPSDYLLAIPTRERLSQVLGRVLDPEEFLSDYGIRSMSARHDREPFTFEFHGQRHEVRYQPGESDTAMFGANSNWRGPVWFPLNFLLIESLERYHHFFGDTFKVACPTGSDNPMNLQEVACVLSERLVRLFEKDEKGRRPFWGGRDDLQQDESFRNLLLFHEYFHGESGRGLGASHQTGWTALVIRCYEKLARRKCGVEGEETCGTADRT